MTETLRRGYPGMKVRQPRGELQIPTRFPKQDILHPIIIKCDHLISLKVADNPGWAVLTCMCANVRVPYQY